MVDDLNRLIAFQDAAVDRAKTHAGDLAHGLKTPLAVLDALARQATADGSNTLADAVARRSARCGVRSTGCWRGPGPASRRRSATRASRWLRSPKRSSACSGNCPTPGPCNGRPRSLPPRAFRARTATTEILGNLIDNARKWARGQVRVTVRAGHGVLTMCVEDDGPGLSLEQVEQVGRGQRWDETQPGTGFGVAITRDLAEGYRGTLDLGRSDLGGLRATVTVPLPPHGPIAAA